MGAATRSPRTGPIDLSGDARRIRCGQSTKDGVKDAMPPRVVACPVCAEASVSHGTPLVMGKYPADYRRCTGCGAVFVADPTWLGEAYDEPINDEDSGLLERCGTMSARTSRILAGERISDGRFLDWGGGYGTFTRMMRDKGYDFFHADAYCANLFARGFEDVPGTEYDLITAFEVFEHLGNPIDELAEVAGRTDRLLFSTGILPNPVPAVEDWWYYGPEHGQHITVHTVESLRILGHRLGFQLTTNGINLHLFHRNPLRASTRFMFSRAGRSARRSIKRLVSVPAAKLGAR